ncbi:MAG TPA: two-component system response regulator [Lentisphaeria bacterium]|nr:two-component system response regulator [Lentisphaeria bacterium]
MKKAPKTLKILSSIKAEEFMNTNTLYPLKPILMIDDEEEVLNSYSVVLSSLGINNFIACTSPEKAFNILKEKEISIILLDLLIPKYNKDEVLDYILANYPEIPVIIISGVNEIYAALRCIKKGAFDYLLKPVDRETLSISVKMALDRIEFSLENKGLKNGLFSDSNEIHESFSGIITNNQMMKSIFRYCEIVARSSQPVLICGETGTGKELIARALYKLNNFTGSFVPVNVAGLDDNMFTDTLFGHTKGAYTGAMDFREGLVKKAENGLLFLDEIGDLGLQSQVKLLRLLQEREYSSLGSDLIKLSKAKVILATNTELQTLIESGKFRKDLYFRLSSHQIKIPPLRDRIEDIPLLLKFFIADASKSLGIKPPSYHPDLELLLKSYNFPGNIRELQGMVYNAVSEHKSHMLSSKSFKNYIDNCVKENSELARKTNPDNKNLNWVSMLPENLPPLNFIEDMVIDEALKRANGIQTIAARMLNISSQALNKRIKYRNKKKSTP